MIVHHCAPFVLLLFYSMVSLGHQLNPETEERHHHPGQGVQRLRVRRAVEGHRPAPDPRKKNSKRPLEPVVTCLMATTRKAVETTGSLIERLLPKPIYTVTAAGFELKVAFFILTRSLNFVF